MHGEKMLSFGSGENATELAVKVSTYCQGNRLYVGLYNQGDAGLEPFSNLTVNLPYLPAGMEEYRSQYQTEKGSKVQKKDGIPKKDKQPKKKEGMER